jgi:hypothetical protein
MLTLSVKVKPNLFDGSVLLEQYSLGRATGYITDYMLLLG